VTGLLQAPADRPAGKRGIRGAVAAVTTLAALLTLTYGSRWDMPAWGRVVMLAAGAGLVAAAFLFWMGRRRAGLVLAAGLVALAVPAWVVVEGSRRSEQREAEKWGGSSLTYDDKAPVVSRAAIDAVPEGATKDEVKAILGPAAGSGIQHVDDGDDLRCRVYRADRRRFGKLWALCFTGDRYTDLLEW
jgi:hypothetical protein